MMKKYQVFISSTFDDLDVRRSRVMSALWALDYIPMGMENFTASNDSQLQYIHKILETTDLYVLIIGGRYGSIDPESGVSYTEREWQIAQEMGIPTLSFICSDPEKLPREKTDGDNKDLERFRNEVKKSRLCSFWKAEDDPAQLALTVIQSVASFSKEKLKGWSRGEDSHGEKERLDLLHKQAALQEWVSALQQENQRLSASLSELQESQPLLIDDQPLLDADIALVGSCLKSDADGTRVQFNENVSLLRIFQLLAPTIMVETPEVAVFNKFSEILSWELGHSEAALSPLSENEIESNLVSLDLIEIYLAPDPDTSWGSEPIRFIRITDKGKISLQRMILEHKSKEIDENIVNQPENSDTF